MSSLTIVIEMISINEEHAQCVQACGAIISRIAFHSIVEIHVL